jgi:8-oxo-dGTP pyrophosphatase MutT (NUDIX family)
LFPLHIPNTGGDSEEKETFWDTALRRALVETGIDIPSYYGKASVVEDIFPPPLFILCLYFNFSTG